MAHDSRPDVVPVHEPAALPRRARRRDLLRGALAGAAVAAVASATSACRGEDQVIGDSRVGQRSGPDRLAFRPDPGADPKDDDPQAATGTFEVAGLPGRPAAYAYVPADVVRPLQVVVMLHGAGGRPARSLDILSPLADAHGFAVLAPKSVGPTWDRIRGTFGPDVANLDAVLERLARRRAVAGLVLAGFSDGASYALSLGLGNGDLLDGVVAFSPGFAAPATRRGEPPFFVSHGVDDRVLPIERCSRRLVPALEEEGYAVTYREFDGGHEIPQPIREVAGRWINERR